jgi:hypothetical protein
MRLYFIILSLFLFVLSVRAQIRDSLTINYNYINSFPQDAAVYLNDSLAGHTPYRFLLEPKDSSVSYRIVIKLKDYFDYFFTFKAIDIPLNQTFFLIPLSKSYKLSNQVLENKNSYFKTPRKVMPITISALLAAVSGISAFYYKDQANNEYDDYLNSGDPALLDKTKKYDLISGISIVLFQVGLAGLIYFLLIE